MKREFYSPYIKVMKKFKVRGVDWFDKSIGYLLVPFWFRHLYNRRLKRLSIEFKTRQSSPDLVLFSQLIYLISTIKEENKIDERELSKGKDILSLVYPVNGKDWEEITIDYANAYIAFFLQKIR